MWRKTVCMFLIVVFLAAITGCEKKSDSATAPEEVTKTEAEFEAEAQEEIDESNMDAELEKLEEEIEAEIDQEMIE